jgi:hypothetical protein
LSIIIINWNPILEFINLTKIEFVSFSIRVYLIFQYFEGFFKIQSGIEKNVTNLKPFDNWFNMNELLFGGSRWKAKKLNLSTTKFEWRVTTNIIERIIKVWCSLLYNFLERSINYCIEDFLWANQGLQFWCYNPVQSCVYNELLHIYIYIWLRRDNRHLMPSKAKTIISENVHHRHDRSNNYSTFD